MYNAEPAEIAEMGTRFAAAAGLPLVRSPRDVVLSCYGHAIGPTGAYKGSMSDFIRNECHGIRKIVICVGSFSYDLSTFLFRFPPAERPWIVECYRDAVAHRGWHLASSAELDVLFDTAERARYANRVIWPAQALVEERAAWGFPELVEVEQWFRNLDCGSGSG